MIEKKADLNRLTSDPETSLCVLEGLQERVRLPEGKTRAELSTYLMKGSMGSPVSQGSVGSVSMMNLPDLFLREAQVVVRSLSDQQPGVTVVLTVTVLVD